MFCWCSSQMIINKDHLVWLTDLSVSFIILECSFEYNLWSSVWRFAVFQSSRCWGCHIRRLTGQNTLKAETNIFTSTFTQWAHFCSNVFCSSGRTFSGSYAHQHLNWKKLDIRTKRATDLKYLQSGLLMSLAPPHIIRSSLTRFHAKGTFLTESSPEININSDCDSSQVLKSLQLFWFRSYYVFFTHPNVTSFWSVLCVSGLQQVKVVVSFHSEQKSQMKP